MTVDTPAQDAARNGPLFIVINAASGSHSTGDVKAALTGVFTESGRDFEFLEVAEPAHLQAQADRAVAR